MLVFCTGIVFHVYVYAGVPPVTLTEAVPVAAPLHKTFVELPIAVNPKQDGSFTTVLPDIKHPFASVIVAV